MSNCEFAGTKKTWQFHFEGAIEVEAENEGEALELAIDLLETVDIGWWEILESDPDRMT